jgi:hypothetical protein
MELDILSVEKLHRDFTLAGSSRSMQIAFSKHFGNFTGIPEMERPQIPVKMPLFH